MNSHITCSKHPILETSLFLVFLTIEPSSIKLVYQQSTNNVNKSLRTIVRNRENLTDSISLDAIGCGITMLIKQSMLLI